MAPGNKYENFFQSLVLHNKELGKDLANFFVAFESAQIFRPTTKIWGFYI